MSIISNNPPLHEKNDRYERERLKENFSACADCPDKNKITNWVIFGVSAAICLGILIWIFVGLRKKHKYRNRFYKFTQK